MTTADSMVSMRRGVYWLLAAIALGGMLGRILAVNSVDRIEIDKGRQAQHKPITQRPFLSANDRSRWATVRSLVELGTYQIDDIVSQPNWDTIDMVKLPDGHLYSSKPPLLATLIAGPYWLIHRVTGKTLATHPYEIGRSLLIFVNVLPMLWYFCTLARLIDRYGGSDWGRIFTFAVAAVGTFLTTFVIVVNNHLPAAVCLAVAVDAAVRIWCEHDERWVWFFVSGLFGGLLAAFELPALAFTALLGLALLWKFPTSTLRGFAPGLAIVAAAALGTNYLAVGTVEPAYKHKEWYDYSYIKDGKQRDSYWRHRVGIDRGERSRAIYAFNALLGHHGIFSLSPVWLLAILGLVMQIYRREWPLRPFVLLAGAVSIICFVFYVLQPREDRNYGGMTSGLRWMFWMAPVWLLALLPAADAMARRRWTRGIALVFLVWSVLSVAYPTWNPWTHPWLTNFARYEGWVDF